MTEDKPHIVFQNGHKVAYMYPNYAQAHAYWKLIHDHKSPALIATVGRVIDPATPVIDVNE